MATPLDWSKFTLNGNVLSAYDGNPLGGTYGSWWDQGNAKPGAVTPWGTTIGANTFDPGTLGAGNTQSYDQFLNLQGGQNLGENQRYQDGALQTYNGDTGWSIDPSSNTDGSISPYQNKFELNSGFHRYDINNLLQTGGGEHASAWQNILPYLKGEDLLAYDPQWGVVAKDSKSAERIGALIDTIHGSYAGPEQRAALRSSLIAMASMGLGAALAPAAGSVGGAGAAAAEGGGSLLGTGFGEVSGGLGGLGGGAGGVDGLLQGPMPNGGNLSNYVPLQGPMPSGGNLSDYNFLNTTPQGPMPSGWNLSDYNYINSVLQGPTQSGGNISSPGLLDQIKSIYNSPEAQMAKTIASGTQSALNAAQQAGLLGGGQAQASGGGGSMGLLGAQSGGRGRSFAELSPYARGLLRG